MTASPRCLRGWRGGALALLVVVWSGCLEVEITTEVHPDGSLKRFMELRGDSANIGRGLVLFGIDSLWHTETRDSGADQLVIAADRSFSSAEEMAAVLKGIPGSKLSIVPSLVYTFGWFVTTYRYTETWTKVSATDEVPLADYISPGEVEKINRHILRKEPFAAPADSLAVADATDRFDAWQARNRFERFFRILLAGIRTLADPALTVRHVEEKKEEFFRIAGTFDFATGDLGNLAGELGTVAGGARLGRALEAAGEEMDLFRNELRFEQMVFSYGYRVRVRMPGEITGTNAPAVDGNVMTWDDFIVFASIGDFEMWGESRRVNWWVIVLSAVALAALVVVGVVRLRRRNVGDA